MFNENHLNLLLRTCIVFVLLLILQIVISIGPLAFLIGAFVLQTLCYAEILDIYFKSDKPPSPKFYLPLAIYLYFVVNSFLCGAMLFLRYACIEDACNLLFKVHSPYHMLITYILYLIGFIYFIMKMPTGNLRNNIRYYFCLHITYMFIVVPVYLAMQNMLYGLFWLVIPILLVSSNDLCAYIFGKTIGKTPLFQLSPKKTWEGFIGGAFGTLLLAHFIGIYIVDVDYFLCPVNSMTSTISNKLVYSKDEEASSSTKRLFYLHVIVMSLFASLIAPFGGFFASGFKRANAAKNFSNLLPGHGGFVDRFDCQFLMAVVVNVYIRTFIRNEKAELVLSAFEVVNTS